MTAIVAVEGVVYLLLLLMLVGTGCAVWAVVTEVRDYVRARRQARR